MKKKYTTPGMKVANLNLTKIINASAGFGEGETNVMHSKRYGDFIEEDDDLIEE